MNAVQNSSLLEVGLPLILTNTTKLGKFDSGLQRSLSTAILLKYAAFFLRENLDLTSLSNEISRDEEACETAISPVVSPSSAEFISHSSKNPLDDMLIDSPSECLSPLQKSQPKTPTRCLLLKSSVETSSIEDSHVANTAYCLRQTQSTLMEFSVRTSDRHSSPSPEPKTRQSYRHKPGNKSKFSPLGANAKRTTALEGNKIAAAKCRVKKKHQVAVLQAVSQRQIATNRALKKEVLEGMEEVQLLHRHILSHAVADGCKAPEEMHATLCLRGAFRAGFESWSSDGEEMTLVPVQGE